jgi:cytoskeletal protein CcmA (bactofilin family)
MTDVGLEKNGAPAVNGDSEAHAVEPAMVTVLAKEDVLAGRLHLKGSGSILGSFSGHVVCDGDLLIGGDAHVEADIRGARVTVAGFVRGNITAATRLKITSTGRLEGDARVGALIVQEGGVHHGVIRVHPEGVPDGADEIITDAAPRPVQAGLKSFSDPVGRVRKLWGEFF